MDLGEYPDNVNQQFMAAVRAVSGEDGIKCVVEVAGGISLKIPRFASEACWLTRAIGLEAAIKVCEAMRVCDANGRPIGGLKLRIPLGDSSFLKRRALRTRRLLLEGLSVRDVAREVGCGERTVFKARATLVAEGVLKRRKR